MIELSLGALMQGLAPIGSDWNSFYRGFGLVVLGLIIPIVCFLLLEWLGKKACWPCIKRKTEEDWEAHQGVSISQILFTVFVICVLGVLILCVFVATVFFVETPFGTMPPPIRDFMNLIALCAVVGGIVRVMAKTDVLGLVMVLTYMLYGSSPGAAPHLVNGPLETAYPQEYTRPSIRLV